MQCWLLFWAVAVLQNRTGYVESEWVVFIADDLAEYLRRTPELRFVRADHIFIIISWVSLAHDARFVSYRAVHAPLGQTHAHTQKTPTLRTPAAHIVGHLPHPLSCLTVLTSLCE